MFDRIAGVYDVMNRVMTAGQDVRWRRRAVEISGASTGDTALDVCCGTGDLTFELGRTVGSGGRVVGCDFSEQMLAEARDKADRDGVSQTGNVEFEWADALDLPYRDDSFDAITVGFGVRNLARLDDGIAEMVRVLRPGGRLAILEITTPRRQPFAGFFSLWFDRIVPLLGKVAGDSSAYTYLPDSVRKFPKAPELAAMCAVAGLEDVRYSLLAGGIVAIHSGAKPGPAGS